ncbi:CGNR zinc finger domain-containing protein [Jiangella aurantiaca]|uniref:CGNR zinc finger domain-containing protein n=1 Tax=Jiangella aurantiaca TaxID=2530373 RepID=UPI0013A5D36C|nr:ABATE domain-containing protein [Jiangella aurantiaca]
MAGAVALDPRTYGGTYKLIGGSPALDFANLVSYRGTPREHDWLDPAANASEWARAAGLDVAIGDVAMLRDVREVLARVFLAVADGAAPAAADVALVGELAADAWTRRRLVLSAGEPPARWSDRAATLLDELALDAAGLLTSAERLDRVTACDECRWVFLDATRNRSRRWCDPADCGNRSRQRRHYERRRGR